MLSRECVHRHIGRLSFRGIQIISLRTFTSHPRFWGGILLYQKWFFYFETLKPLVDSGCASATLDKGRQCCNTEHRRAETCDQNRYGVYKNIEWSPDDGRDSHTIGVVPIKPKGTQQGDDDICSDHPSKMAHRSTPFGGGPQDFLLRGRPWIRVPARPASRNQSDPRCSSPRARAS